MDSRGGVEPRSRRTWVVLIAALGAIGSVAVAAYWFKHRPVPCAVGALPDLPKATGIPTKLMDRLKTAQAQACTDPQNPHGLPELARLYHASGYFPAAEICWRLLRQMQPREPHWCYYLADLRRMAADDAAVKSLLEETVALAPDYAPAWLELGDFAFKHGNSEGAITSYRRRLDLVPRDPYARLGLARIILQRGQHEEGKHILEALVRDVPNFSSAHNVYAELLAGEGERLKAANQRWLGTKAGRFRAADDPWKEELRAWSYDPEQLATWGSIDLQTKHGDWGKSYFERALRLAPQDPRHYQNLAQVSLNAGDPATGCKFLETASTLPGADEGIYAKLSETYITLNQPAAALRATDQGLARFPQSAHLLDARGSALNAAKRPEEAIESYRAALAVSPGSASALANIGIVQLQLGKTDEAVASFRQALTVQPNFPRAIEQLAGLELDAERLPSAAGYIAPFFEQDPDSEAARNLMGRYYLLTAVKAARSGDMPGAEKTARAGLDVIPEAAPLQAFLGWIYYHQKRVPEALAALENSRRIQPDAPKVLQMLGELYLQLGRIEDARTVLTEGMTQARKQGDGETVQRIGELLPQLPK